MAIAVTAISAVASTVNSATYAINSFTPVANRLYILAIESSHAANAVDPTITPSNTGLNYVKIVARPWSTSSANQSTLSIWRAMKPSGLTTGVDTIDFATIVQTGCTYSLIELTGIDTSGTDGSGAIVQSNSAFDDTTTATAINVTLAALANANNIGYSAAGVNANITQTPGHSETKIDDLGHTLPSYALQTQWLINTATLGTTFVAGQNSGIAAIEIAAAPVAGGIRPSVRQSLQAVQRASVW